jgi:hypothetical protein
MIKKNSIKTSIDPGSEIEIFRIRPQTKITPPEKNKNIMITFKPTFHIGSALILQLTTNFFYNNVMRRREITKKNIIKKKKATVSLEGV